MQSITGNVRRMMALALEGVPAPETISYDVFIERRPQLGKASIAVVMVLSVPNPMVGQLPLTACTDLPSPAPDQATVTRIFTDGVLYLRGQQRAQLS